MEKKVFLLSLIVGFFIFNKLSSQRSQGGLPYSYQSEKLAEFIPLKEMPILEQSTIDLIKEKNKYGPEIFQFAYSFDVSIDVKEESVKDSLDNGLLYRLRIKSVGAKSLNIIFNNYQVSKGAKLFLYNENYKSVKGAFTSINNKPSNKLPVQPISGDELTIEYFEPYFVQTKSNLTIQKISHDIYGIEDVNFGSSGSCQVDINCSEGDEWQDEKRAVCKIIINGSGLCTGSLLNNTSLDGTPFFLTANHCICEQDDAANSVYIFNYESTSCGGGDGSVSQSISGADLRATYAESDFTLLELSETPISTYNPFYAGWDRTNTQGRGGVGIHHPRGDVKKISTHNVIPDDSDCMNFNYDAGCGNDFYPNENFWRINWIATENGYSITEGGSSGSPLFNNESRVIGQLFGAGVCDNPDCGTPENDIANFGKIFTSWANSTNVDERLQDWLDPIGNGVDFLDGAGICDEGVELNLIITDDVTTGTSITFQAVNSIEASNTIESGATAIYEADEKILLNPGFKAELGSSFIARISNMNCVVGCYPINLVTWTNYVTKGSDLCFNISNAENFNISIYTISGSLIHTNSGSIPGNSVCVWNTTNVAIGIYLATVSFSNNCDEISNSYQLFVTSSTKSASLSDQLGISTNNLELESAYNNENFVVEVYPNPSNGIFIVEILRTEKKPYSIEIYNSTGKTIYKVDHLINNKLNVNQDGLTDGIYYLRIISGINIATKKIIIY